MTFADYFFDSFFVDMAVNSRIEQAAREADAVLARIHGALSSLEAMRSDTEAEARRVDAEDERVLTAGI